MNDKLEKFQIYRNLVIKIAEDSLRKARILGPYLEKSIPLLVEYPFAFSKYGLEVRPSGTCIVWCKPAKGYHKLAKMLLDNCGLEYSYLKNNDQTRPIYFILGKPQPVISNNFDKKAVVIDFDWISPLTVTIGGSLGLGLVGYVAGKLLSFLFPEVFSESAKAKMGLTGLILGMVPGLIWGLTNSAILGGKGWLINWPFSEERKIRGLRYQPVNYYQYMPDRVILPVPRAYLQERSKQLLSQLPEKEREKVVREVDKFDKTLASLSPEKLDDLDRRLALVSKSLADIKKDLQEGGIKTAADFKSYFKENKLKLAKLAVSFGLTDPEINNKLLIPIEPAIYHIYDTPGLSSRDQLSLGSIIYASSAANANSSWVTPMDVAKITAGMGSGYLSGLILSKALGAFLGLTPEAQDVIKKSGLLAGLLKGISNMILG
jgi:hypothetical protein